MGFYSTITTLACVIMTFGCSIYSFYEKETELGLVWMIAFVGWLSTFVRLLAQTIK